VWPWDFQSANAKDKKADVKHRYTKTQAFYLSRKGVLPTDVDIFGMNATADDYDDEEGLFSTGDDSEPEPAEDTVEEAVEETVADAVEETGDDADDEEINDLFG
jgi:hypothetical protein